MPPKILRVLLPVVILGAGVALAVLIFKLKPKAERKPPQTTAQLVELKPLRAEKQVVQLEVNGLVTPRHEVRLIPEVGGKITYTADSLVPGGHVKKGEVLVRIDPREYSLQVEQLRGQIGSAELAVEQEEAAQDLAKYEWKVLGEEGAAPPLFSRESQRAAAESALSASKSALSRARLNLSRTTLVAPFDATVVSKGADVGQVVGPQSQLAHLVGTSEMWVLASVAVEDLDLISIPGVGSEEGAKASVVQKLARGKRIQREGQVTRLVQQLDERTRRAQVVITVPQALDTSEGLPLLPGAYVEVTLFGKSFDQVFSVPREAVYEGNTVWVAEDTDGQLKKLARREVQIAWGNQQQVFVTSGLKDGDNLVLTQLSGPIPGAEVKPVEPALGANGSKPKPDSPVLAPKPEASAQPPAAAR